MRRERRRAKNGASDLVKSLSSTEPLPQIPSFKRSKSATSKLPLPKSAQQTVVALEGRENVLFSQSTGGRRSLRTRWERNGEGDMKQESRFASMLTGLWTSNRS